MGKSYLYHDVPRCIISSKEVLKLLDYITVEQIAENLGIREEAVRRWLRSGQLKGYKLGDRAGWRVKKGDLEVFLESKSNEQGSSQNI